MSKKTLNEILNKPSDMGYNNTGNDCDLLTMQEEEAMMQESGPVNSERIVYRKDGLKKFVDSITDEIIGRNISFREFLTDKNDRLDVKKVDAFVAELISFLPKSEKLSKEKAEFLRLFLKCTIIAPGQETWFDIYVGAIHVSRTENFLDLINAAKCRDLNEKTLHGLGYTEEEDQLYSEYACGFFWFMNTGLELLYEDLDLRTTYAPEELKGANDAYEDIVGCPYGDKLPPLELYVEDEELARLSSDKNTKVTIAGTDIEVSLKKMPSEENKEDPGDVDFRVISGGEEESESTEYETLFDANEWDADKQAVLEECAASEEKYKAGSPADHSFADDLKSLKELLFKVDHSDLETLITDMSDGYLMSHGLSPLCMGREYGLISHSLDVSLENIRKSIDKARKNS